VWAPHRNPEPSVNGKEVSGREGGHLPGHGGDGLRVHSPALPPAELPTWLLPRLSWLSRWGGGRCDPAPVVGGDTRLAVRGGAGFR
jgi:hypothetical protein